jgi:hypothetical protein
MNFKGHEERRKIKDMSPMLAWMDMSLFFVFGRL